MSKDLEDIYELTPMQKGMLFHSVYVPESTVHVIQLAMDVVGELDLGAFEAAWGALIRRHGVLRTGFLWEDLERPLQFVRHSVELALVKHDWRGYPAGELEARCKAFLEQDQTRGFDLSTPPLTRLTLIALSDHRHRLIWTFHHILLEGWSAAILWKELWRLYQELQGGPAAELPAAPAYARFVQWLKQQDEDRARRYWSKTLSGCKPGARLPFDRGSLNTPARVAKVKSASRALSPELTRRLSAFARAQRVTMNTLIAGAWAALLARYTGESDLILGAVVSGRPPDLPDAEQTVGLFINTLPARVEITADARVGVWLRALQAALAEMREYEHSALTDIRSYAGMRAHQTLFQTLIAFENWLGRMSLGEVVAGLRLENVASRQGADQPLSLVVTPGDTLGFTLMYDPQRFDSADMSRMLSHLETITVGMMRQPKARVSEISLLDESERRQMLLDWNATTSTYPREASIATLFEAQVSRSPDALAVSFGDELLTYGELDERASGLARWLRGRGVGADVPVGVLMERSVGMVVAWLGIVKAGGAYVPLDPEYPSQRLKFMLADTDAPVLLTQTGLSSRVPGYEGRVLCLDRDWGQVEGEAGGALGKSASALDLAYIIYTSGSTGEPKGVAVPHRAVIRLVRETDYLQLDETDCVVQASNASFDATTFEVWGALLNGARLEGVVREVALNPEAFGEFLRARGATALFVTTALFNQLVREAPGCFSGLRALLFGGEAVDVERVREALSQGSAPGRLLHVYGPTESTTFATWYEVEAVEAGARTIPIGRPIRNTTVYVLDARMEPVPVGVPGELYIGGDGLACGYWNRPALTAEKFVASPFDPDERLYRTGDLVRYRGDGALEFLGRLDDQVKLRGFRIELGEVEAVLGAHEGVREAVVLCREDVPGDKRLVGYVVCTPGMELSVGELRGRVREALPEYMVPSAFVVLDALPLTPNGKVDRGALPVPEGERQVEDAYLAPRGELEARIAEIWRELLRVEQVGVHDNFFDLGGNSLLVLRLKGRLGKELGLDLPVTDLFEHTTVNLLAKRFARSKDEVDSVRPAQNRARKQREIIARRRLSRHRAVT